MHLKRRNFLKKTFFLFSLFFINNKKNNSNIVIKNGWILDKADI